MLRRFVNSPPYGQLVFYASVAIMVAALPVILVYREYKQYKEDKS